MPLLAIVVLVVALLALLATGRSRIVALWPSAAPLYTVFGLQTPVAGNGLALRDVNSAVTQIHGTPTLVVAGRVVNIVGVPETGAGLDRHPARYQGYGAKIRSDYAHSGTVLLAGEGEAFQFSLASPPETATSAW